MSRDTSGFAAMLPPILSTQMYGKSRLAFLSYHTIRGPANAYNKMPLITCQGAQVT